MLPSFLVSILAPDASVPAAGHRVRWPGDDREWVWTGEQWVGLRVTFDGGDSWMELEGYEDAADAA